LAAVEAAAKAVKRSFDNYVYKKIVIEMRGASTDVEVSTGTMVKTALKVVRQLPHAK
jgi:hypothetical protein